MTILFVDQILSKNQNVKCSNGSVSVETVNERPYSTSSYCIYFTINVIEGCYT